MSDFEKLSELLKPYAERLNTKIWICEKIGRRLSCIARAGEESYCESYIAYEDDKYAVFCEREITDDEKDLIMQALSDVVRFRKLSSDS
ncbi:hypothetical protein Ferpe_0288 [Fervidobacterium pennivorans DSM 9078]|uniref:Uncharacterized protein n=1 Tax=Fervidobacterium pennivorans (strain DSM 9078 / Ven5) TaxID=771875 RepID=H9UA86_FERPD|nr:hypothetical protein [Fervidobacterium pennivorans]AFG34429.1 hypothetical protein Ferpe_0288 [Fervidobacterium pennivorans DSM 9078]